MFLPVSSSVLVSRAYGSSYGYLTAAELAGFAGMTAGGALMGTWGGFSRKEKTLSIGLILFLITAIINLIGKILIRRAQHV